MVIYISYSSTAGKRLVFTTPPTGTLVWKIVKLFAHVWEHVPIEEGSEVEVRARAQSNLLIVEGAACRTGAGFMMMRGPEVALTAWSSRRRRFLCNK